MSRWCIDTSASMRADLPLVMAAATGLVRALGPADRGAVVEVSDRAAIAQPFTSDRGQVERAIHGLSATGSTALYDGLYVVLREFARERRSAPVVRRQVLVLLSDGLDNKSRLSFDDVQDRGAAGGGQRLRHRAAGRRGEDAALGAGRAAAECRVHDEHGGPRVGRAHLQPQTVRPNCRRSTPPSRRSWPRSTSWATCRRGPAGTAPTGA